MKRRREEEVMWGVMTHSLGFIHLF